MSTQCTIRHLKWGLHTLPSDYQLVKSNNGGLCSQQKGLARSTDCPEGVRKNKANYRGNCRAELPQVSEVAGIFIAAIGDKRQLLGGT